jgi:hypothetical protein
VRPRQRTVLARPHQIGRLGEGCRSARRIAHVVEFTPGEKLVMQSVEGPFRMHTVYAFEETRDGHTRMTMRNHGEPSGVSKLMTPMIATAMRSAGEKDLAKLKAILEGHA